MDRALGCGQRMKGVPLASRVQRILMLLLVVYLCGCLSVTTRHVTVLSAEQRAQAARLPVYMDALPPGTFESAGEVSGLSCQVNQADGNRVSEAQAMEELRRASVRAGGDAVMSVVCGEYLRGQGRHNCVRAVECRGEAVRTKPPEAGGYTSQTMTAD